MSDELLRIESRLDPDLAAVAAVDDYLTLPFELRQRSRLRTCLDSGQEVGLFLERGQMLRGGDRLCAADGRVIEVRAASETVSTVHAADKLGLLRAAYHLGNRHVVLQITTDWLRYAHDHVLDHMVRGMGLPVHVEQAPFEPEGGAYSVEHEHGLTDGHVHEH